MTSTTATAFGRVLSGLLEERGLKAVTETVGQPVLDHMASTNAGHPEYLGRLAEELDLGYEEMQRLALAYSFEQE
jgi:hypothetical protein